MFTESDLAALVGHRFPGGRYRVEHWENWLLTDCTGRDPMPDGLVHPIILFHAPILGAGTSIGELFRLGGVDGSGGSVGLDGYDWRYHEPLREAVTYDVVGGITSAERHVAPSGAIDDVVAFSIALSHDDRPIATITNTWRFRRVVVAGAPRSIDQGTPEPAGEPIPEWDMPAVDAARMRTMAALLRDPYPVHWDRAANEHLGLGGRVINQGPLNLSYIANMLMAWAGDGSVRRLTVSFGRPVLDGDHVVAGGVVREIVETVRERVDEPTRRRVAHCDVWLRRGDERVVTGTAEVESPRP
jgi:acyl dehydratase